MSSLPETDCRPNINRTLACYSRTLPVLQFQQQQNSNKKLTN